MMYSPAVTPGTTPPSAPGEPPKKKKRVNNNVVYSEPQSRGTGNELGTQVYHAIKWLKEFRYACRIEQWAAESRVTMTPELVEVLRSHDSVDYNEKNHTYAYKGEHSQIHNRATLLHALKANAREGKGIHVRELKDGWPNVYTEIDQLEKEGLLFATRTPKDNQVKAVFWNDLNGKDGGMAVDQEFKDLWNTLRVPAEVDMLRSLANDGLQAATGAPLVRNGPGTVKKKGKKHEHKMRHVKLTNTHVDGVDVSKAFKPADSK